MESTQDYKLVTIARSKPLVMKRGDVSEKGRFEAVAMNVLCLKLWRLGNPREFQEYTSRLILFFCWTTPYGEYSINFRVLFFWKSKESLGRPPTSHKSLNYRHFLFHVIVELQQF